MKLRIAAMLVLLGMVFAPAMAEKSFSTDPDAIEKAAKSVLMLEVFDEEIRPICSGSGFVAFDSGTLVTNYHVMENAFGAKAYSDEGKTYLILDVLAADAEHDIAICSFHEPTDLQPLEFNVSDELKRAQSVVAIGSPEGFTNSVSLGNISAIYKDESLIQFTAPISRGSSGGALFDDSGRVIGITTGALNDGQNLNFARHASDVVSLYREQVNSAFEPAALPVQEDAPEPTADSKTVSIEIQPKSIMAKIGAKASVTVQASGEGLKYSWFASDRGDNGIFYESPTITGNIYSVRMNTERSGRKVYCVVQDAYGNTATSHTVTLNCESGLKIDRQPMSVSVPRGEHAEVRVQAEGEGLKYTWYASDVEDNDVYYMSAVIKGDTYSVLMDDVRNGRKVYCVITDAYGNTITSDTAVLSME